MPEWCWRSKEWEDQGGVGRIQQTAVLRLIKKWAIRFARTCASSSPTRIPGQAWKERSARHLAWPGKHIWISTTSAHQLATQFFHIPDRIWSLVSHYFKDMQMIFALQDFTTRWQNLEVGITMECSISPILFVATFKVILNWARQIVGGVRLPSGQKLRRKWEGLYGFGCDRYVGKAEGGAGQSYGHWRMCDRR